VVGDFMERQVNITYEIFGKSNVPILCIDVPKLSFYICILE